MKILIIRLSSLGDVILSTYLLRLIRKIHPNSQIDFLVSNGFQDVLKFNPHINNILIYNKEESILHHWKNTLSIFNKMYYDVIIDLQNNFRSFLFSVGKFGSIYKFNKRRWFKFKLVNFKKRTNNIDPIPVLYKNTYPLLRNIDDGLGLELWTHKDREFYTPHFKTQEICKIKNISIAPGAKHFTKRYPQQKFLELINELKYRYDAKIHLIGGKEDIPFSKFLLNKDPEIKDFVDKLNVIETAELVDEMDLVISNDTSAVHIASARNVPVIQIFGSTVPELGFIPFRVPYRIIERHDVKCRPCTHYGKSKCPKGHFDCMNKITTEEILQAVESLIKKSQSN